MFTFLTTDTKALWAALVLALATNVLQYVLRRRSSVYDYQLSLLKSKHDETQQRRSEAEERALLQDLAFLDRQISELYGPLFSLIDRLDVVYEIEHGIVDPNNLSEEQKGIVRDYIQKNYYSVVHAQIDEILRTKLYLIDAAQVPDNYREYVAHATQSDIQKALFSEFRIPTDHLKGVEYPGDINGNIDESLKSALQRKALLLSKRASGRAD